MLLQFPISNAPQGMISHDAKAVVCQTASVEMRQGHALIFVSHGSVSRIVDHFWDEDDVRRMANWTGA